jgi:26S proteasome regulatory subunit (ATPase 3-interacting protein)
LSPKWPKERQVKKKVAFLSSLTDDLEGSEAILAYLKKQNRPYSAVDVFNNLKGEYGKTAVTKALTQLQEEGFC